MITTRLYLDCRDKKPGQPAPLKFVITKNKVRALVSLNVKIPASDWNSLKQKASGEYAYLNPLLAQKKSLLDNLIFHKEASGEFDGLKSSEIKRIIESNLFGEKPEEESNENGFKAVFQRFQNSRPSQGTRGVYAQTWRAIERYCAYKKIEADKLEFEHITVKWLNDFDAFLSKTIQKQNAKNIHFRNIRAVFNDALDDELINCYPFRKFKIRAEATRKRSLSCEDLRRVFDYNADEYALIYRDMFKLIFCLCGINSVDLYNLERISPDGRIEYNRAKTKRPYSIKVEPEALEIIERWKGKAKLLCLADRWSDHTNFRHQMNKALQSLGMPVISKHGKKDREKSMFPMLTTYWARHSWATIARKIGVSKDDIKLALGHGSQNVSDIYIEEDLEKIDIANRKVLDWVLYGKK